MAAISSASAPGSGIGVAVISTDGVTEEPRTSVPPAPTVTLVPSGSASAASISKIPMLTIVPPL